MVVGKQITLAVTAIHRRTHVTKEINIRKYTEQ